MKFDLAVNGLRFLSIDMVEKAGSGHPGAAMGMADFFTVLFSDFLRFDPENPNWENRDRLILSNGHASTILYSALFLAGFQDISLADLKRYREFGANTTGHPEYLHYSGIEATTGPLGQGFAMAVGMAMAERLLHRDCPLFDHHTYVVLGDGCLMEGISYEAAAFAGRQNLSKLILLFDDNSITIEGSTNLVTVEDRVKIFENMGWSCFCADGHNRQEISEAIQGAKESRKPSFVALKTKIGYGAPSKEGNANVHGAPLGSEEMEATRKNLGWPYPPFEIPQEGLDLWRSFSERNKGLVENWKNAYRELSEVQKGELARRRNRDLPTEAINALNQLKEELSKNPKRMPTRKATPLIVDRLASALPELIGGSGDLGESNGSLGATMESIFPENNYQGNYIHYGIREHFLAAAINGFAIYGCFKSYGSTYFVFSDYMRPAIRLAAIMEVPSIFLYSHDSIGVGPDGPTHQAVEQLASLRNIPRLKVYRPADSVESVECWKLVLEEKHNPSAIVMSRQDSSPVRTRHCPKNLSEKGGYQILKVEEDEVVLISSGTDVSFCLEASKILKDSGIRTSVVSVPCLERLLEQSEDYKNELFGKNRNVLRIAVESAIDSGWSKWLGDGSFFFGMEDFGLTGASNDLFRHYGLDGEGIAKKVKDLMI
ncbi:MAG: transketolase [SAR324 cluster bacterium]|nr:transketolase [SAR324 cluster bacterium]